MPRRKNHRLPTLITFSVSSSVSSVRLKLTRDRPRCPQVRDTNVLLVETEGIEEQEKERKRARDTLKAIDKEI